MSLKKRISSAVNKAFLAADDLKKVGVLKGQTVKDYNLALGSIVESASKSLIIDVILTESAKNDDSTKTYSALIKSGVDITVYKEIVIDKKSYRIASYTDNDYVIELNLVREG